MDITRFILFCGILFILTVCLFKDVFFSIVFVFIFLAFVYFIIRERNYVMF